MTMLTAHVTDKDAPWEASFADSIVLIPPLLSPDIPPERSNPAGWS